MNGIEKIIARIEADSQDECRRISEQAKERAEEILRDGEVAAAGEYEAAITEGRKTAQERRKRLVSSSKSEAGKLVLASKQKILGETYELAMKKLCAHSKKAELLASLAFRASVTGRGSIIMNPADKDSIGHIVVKLANEKLAAAAKTAELTLSDTTRDICGGLYLAEGSIETNCTFESLINAQRTEYAAEAAKVLFL